jgi:hypothetical protein
LGWGDFSFVFLACYAGAPRAAGRQRIGTNKKI